MKEDYLWDKTGSDPEIEKLENALKMFRQQDPTPPELPVKAFEFDTKSVRTIDWRRLFSFGVISFACLALAVFSFGAFRLLNLTDVKRVTSGSSDTKPRQTELATKTIPDTVYEPAKPIGLKAKPSKSAPRKVSRLRIKNKAKRPSSKRSIRKRKPRTKPQTLVLTEEEKHAYNQLMLALSVTSSNLKLVKDKVQGD